MNDENSKEDNPDNAENDEQDLNEALESPEEALDDDITATSDEELELAKAAAKTITAMIVIIESPVAT